MTRGVAVGVGLRIVLSVRLKGDADIPRERPYPLALRASSVQVPTFLRGSRPGTGRGENRERRTEPATGKRETDKTWTKFAPDSALRKPDRTVGPQSR